MDFQIEKFTGWRRAKKTGELQLKTRRLGYAHEDYDTWDDIHKLWKQDPRMVTSYLRDTYADTGDMTLLQSIEALEDTANGTSDTESYEAQEDGHEHESTTMKDTEAQEDNSDEQMSTSAGDEIDKEPTFWEGQRVQAHSYMFGHEWARKKYRSRWRTHREKGTIIEIIDDDKCLVLWDGDKEPLTSAFRHLEPQEETNEGTIKMLRNERREGWATWMSNTLIALTGTRTCCASLLQATLTEEETINNKNRTSQINIKYDVKKPEAQPDENKQEGRTRAHTTQARGPIKFHINKARSKDDRRCKKARNRSKAKTRRPIKENWRRRSKPRQTWPRAHKPIIEDWRRPRPEAQIPLRGASWRHKNRHKNKKQQEYHQAHERQRTRLRCGYCAQGGHTQRDCTLKKSHREQMQRITRHHIKQRTASYDAQHKGANASSNDPKCKYCGKIGHTKGSCEMMARHKTRRESLRRRHQFQKTETRAGQRQDQHTYASKRRPRRTRRRSRGRDRRRPVASHAGLGEVAIRGQCRGFVTADMAVR